MLIPVYPPRIEPLVIARAVVIGLSVAFALVVGSLAMAEPGAMDFVAHYAAARLVLQGQGPAILDPAAGLAAEQAVVPERVRLLPLLQMPALALIRAPMALLPFETAFVLMAALDVALIVGSVALLVPRDRLVAAVILASPPASVAVAHGQSSPIALFLVALAIRLGDRAAGLALGLTLLRIQSAPLLVLAGLADPARRVWTAVGAFAVMTLSVLVVGPEGLVRYAATLMSRSEILQTGDIGMRAAVGWSGAALLIGSPQLGIALAVASLLVGAVVVVRADPAARPAVAAAWSLLAAPNLLLHDAVLAFPLLVTLGSRKAMWDVGASLAWLTHAIIAPVGVLWSLVLAASTLRR